MRGVAGFMVLFGVLTAIAVATATAARTRPSSPAAGAVRGVFFAAEAPDLAPDELALLDGLTRVDSVEALEARLSDATSLIAVDASALDRLPDGYLARRLAEGRAIVGVNVFGSDLGAAAGFPSRDWPTPEQWAQSHDGQGEGAFYSYMYRSPPGRDSQQSGGGQHHFKDRLLPAVLQKLLEGGWRE